MIVGFLSSLIFYRVVKKFHTGLHDIPREIFVAIFHVPVKIDFVRKQSMLSGILEALAYSRFGRAVIQRGGIFDIDPWKPIDADGLK